MIKLRKVRPKKRRLTEKKKKEIRRVEKIIKWISGKDLCAFQKRALEAEEKAISALKYFQSKRTIFKEKGAIKRIKQSSHYDADDQNGIDVKIEFENKEVLFLQIKNHWSND
ncbi:MAG: hypothetical protein PHN37_00670, partial [Candidatus Pacebacteria bacterium]|nr:hypothetical protein [Candidatus Paceibacterota bacterium]